MAPKIVLLSFALALLGTIPGLTEPSVADHVPTGAYCCNGYANDTVDPHLIVPYVTWANTDRYGAIADRAAGVKYTIQYFDVSRVYRPDRAFPLVDSGKFMGARAMTCAGAPIQASSPGGYVTDPWKPETLQLVDDEVTRLYNPAFTAYFMDDVDSIRWGMTNGPPCNGSTPWSEPETAKAYAALAAGVRVEADGRSVVPKIIINGLSEYDDKPALHLSPLYALAPANVLGGMCEGCFGNNSPDKVIRGAEWQDDVDLEIKTARMHKIFWDYVRYGANDPAARLYTFASFMLAWDPDYTIYQTNYKANTMGQLRVTPETGIVAHDPVKRPIDSVDGLRDAGGTFVREYRRCYYRRSPIGPCAFVVNSDTAPHRRPELTERYEHTVTLQGGMVLEGGTISTRGPTAPDTVPPESAFVLTR